MGEVSDAEILSDPVAQAVSRLGIAPEYGGEPLNTHGREFFMLTALEKAILAEEFSRVDVDAFMSLPGGSMSAVLINALADPAMKKRYFEALVESPTWTFFALTEPGHGSNAVEIESAVTGRASEHRVLNGEKVYIGNASRASFGVVFARTGKSPFAIDAFLIDTHRPGYSAQPLATRAIRGAVFCDVIFQDVQIYEEDLVGNHLSKARRGLNGAMKVFHQLRPTVAAMSLGVGAGLLDEIDRQGLNGIAPNAWATLRRRESAVRAAVTTAAQSVDAGHGTVASAVKVLATLWSLDVARAIQEHIPVLELIHCPKLLQGIENTRAIQFMEGTLDMQRAQVFQGINSSRRPQDMSHSGPNASAFSDAEH